MPRVKKTPRGKRKTKSVSEAHSVSIIDYIEKLNQSRNRSVRSRKQNEAESSDSASENRSTRVAKAGSAKTIGKKRGLSERNTVQDKTEVMKTKTKVREYYVFE